MAGADALVMLCWWTAVTVVALIIRRIRYTYNVNRRKY